MNINIYQAKEKIPISKGRNIIFSDYNAIKLEINYQNRKNEKFLMLEIKKLS